MTGQPDQVGEGAAGLSVEPAELFRFLVRSFGDIDEQVLGACTVVAFECALGAKHPDLCADLASETVDVARLERLALLVLADPGAGAVLPIVRAVTRNPQTPVELVRELSSLLHSCDDALCALGAHRGSFELAVDVAVRWPDKIEKVVAFGFEETAILVAVTTRVLADGQGPATVRVLNQVVARAALPVEVILALPWPYTVAYAQSCNALSSTTRTPFQRVFPKLLVERLGADVANWRALLALCADFGGTTAELLDTVQRLLDIETSTCVADAASPTAA